MPGMTPRVNLTDAEIFAAAFAWQEGDHGAPSRE
jgi:hypothetical protein